MLDVDDPLTKALLDFDIPALCRLREEGADLNARDEWGEPFLFNALFTTSAHDDISWTDTRRYDVIATLIDLGADPHQLASDGESILTGPIFSQDATMLELLLMRGVDPNRGCGEPWETVYSLASFDYHYEAWSRAGDPDLNVLDGVDDGDQDAVLLHLDRQAQAHNRLRPTILLLLRRHGALTNAEMARKLGGDGSERIVWRDGGWHLNAAST